MINPTKSLATLHKVMPWTKSLSFPQTSRAIAGAIQETYYLFQYGKLSLVCPIIYCSACVAAKIESCPLYLWEPPADHTPKKVVIYLQEGGWKGLSTAYLHTPT
jgi:hypothetical protein